VIYVLKEGPNFSGLVDKNEELEVHS